MNAETPESEGLSARSRVTLADIARAAGVTRMTVSNALNNRQGVSADVRERIQRIADEMGYVANWAAKKLSDTRHGTESGIIGVIAEIHTAFMGEVAAAISTAVRDSGRDMLVYSLPDAGKRVPGDVLNLMLHNVDGVIAVLPRNTRDVPTIARASVPIVVVDPLEDDPLLPSVASDSYQGGCVAVRHLIELGHRRIAFLAGEQQRLSARERLRAYLDTMAAAGLNVPAEYVGEGGYLEGPGYLATERLLALPNPPTAIFAANDFSAIGAMAAAHAAGLIVPNDISIVGFDDIRAASQVRPGLTTLRQPFSKIGSTALELLLNAKEGTGRRKDQAKHVLLPTDLIVRGTTSPCSTSK